MAGSLQDVIDLSDDDAQSPGRKKPEKKELAPTSKKAGKPKPAPKPKAEKPETKDDEEVAKAPTKAEKKQQMRKPAAAPKSAKRPASALSGSDEIKVRKYPYKKTGMWAISVNGKEFVQAVNLKLVCRIFSTYCSRFES